ncbi:HDIG domain-containing metalloprotein [Coprothermobacter platensis]|uniref:HDIG domain-containing metalloprotein n=1 Tax=Coprothermobacter platensis TaxID=108819 RepID=UPI0003691C0E|nr:HDIG domain-containing metalloprotein [Coprothermobacter platensis]
MKNRIRYNAVVLLWILGIGILLLGLFPLRAPVENGKFTRSVLTDRNLSIKYGESVESSVMVSDELTVKSYVSSLSKLSEQTTDNQLRQAIASLSKYIQEKGIYETEIPIKKEWLKSTFNLSTDLSQKLENVVKDIITKPTWVARPLDVITAISSAENVVIPAGTLVAQKGDVAQSEQLKALNLMGLWVPGKLILPLKYWIFVIAMPIMWLIIANRSDVYKSYSGIFYYIYGILGSVMFLYAYRFSSLLIAFPLFVFAFMLFAAKFSKDGFWSLVIPTTVLATLSVPLDTYSWIALLLVALLIYSVKAKVFQYETILKYVGYSFFGLALLEILWCFGNMVRSLTGVWYALTLTVMGFLIISVLMALTFLWEERKGFLTPLTILKLSNLRHPLLQRLAIEAPGTYHHSMVLAQMCEEGASAIGANRILARLGAMYHDIGKTKQPQYFIENNPGANDLHEKMSPSLSMLILLSHVKEGLALAEKYKLPTSIREFIATHHGTSIASFFYHKAKTSGVEVSEEEFRYPGPLPKGKEASILMLADGCEAAVRSLDEKNESTIRSTVDSIVKSRLDDGQLNNSELTFKDMSIVENVFVRVLTGLYHPRVQYPGGAET